MQALMLTQYISTHKIITFAFPYPPLLIPPSTLHPIQHIITVMYHTSSKSSPINVHGVDVDGCVSAQFRTGVFYNVPYTHVIIFNGLIFHDFIFEANLYIS